MGSLRFEGVRFFIYTHDHEPPHVHAVYAGVRVIIDLLPDGAIAVACRRNSIQPPNAKGSDVRHVLDLAKQHHAELLSLWKEHHG